LVSVNGLAESPPDTFWEMLVRKEDGEFITPNVGRTKRSAATGNQQDQETESHSTVLLCFNWDPFMIISWECTFISNFLLGNQILRSYTYKRYYTINLSGKRRVGRSLGWTGGDSSPCRATDPQAIYRQIVVDQAAFNDAYVYNYRGSAVLQEDDIRTGVRGAEADTGWHLAKAWSTLDRSPDHHRADT
ncbi:hypothetical protein T07_4425, partial [Trichinella nelsoni]